MEDRIVYSLIVSHSTVEYITEENIFNMLHMLAHKARVTGVALGAHAGVIKKGRVSNVFAMWHNKSLVTVGSFDLRARQVRKSE